MIKSANEVSKEVSEDLIADELRGWQSASSDLGGGNETVAVLIWRHRDLILAMKIKVLVVRRGKEMNSCSIFILF